MKCAIEVQQEIQKEPVVPLRIGLHVGEVFFEDAKALGDGVNVASRIQSLGQASTILFSRDIYDKIKNQPDFKSISLASLNLKMFDEPMEAFALTNEGLIVHKRMEREDPDFKKLLAKTKGLHDTYLVKYSMTVVAE